MSWAVFVCRVPAECPAEIVQLYINCLSELPSQRPKAAELVRVISACADASLRQRLSDRVMGRKSMLLPKVTSLIGAI